MRLVVLAVLVLTVPVLTVPGCWWWRSLQMNVTQYIAFIVHVQVGL